MSILIQDQRLRCDKTDGNRKWCVNTVPSNDDCHQIIRLSNREWCNYVFSVLTEIVDGKAKQGKFTIMDSFRDKYLDSVSYTHLTLPTRLSV